MTRTIAHLSDLHLGASPANERSLRQMVSALVAADVDEVLVTGDVTDRGRRQELDLFRRLTAPLEGRLTVVPGNHDRLGDDAGASFMRDRVSVERRPGLHLVRVDSTAPHNRRLLDAHGMLTEGDVDRIDAALDDAPPGELVVVMLHHHLHALPGDSIWERLASAVGLPNADELPLGRALIERLLGRCDLVLHGHRHTPGDLRLRPHSPRPLRVANAGCTATLRRARLWVHEAGRITGRGWIDVRTPVPAVPALAEVTAAA